MHESSEHAALLHMFRVAPEQAARLLARVHGHEAGGLAVIHAAIAGLRAFDTGDIRMYIDMALGGLPPGRLRRFTEDLVRAHPIPKMDLPTPRADEFIELLEELFEVRAAKRAIMRVIGARNITLTPEQIEVIHTCGALDTLERWLDRAVTATSGAEVLGD